MGKDGKDGKDGRDGGGRRPLAIRQYFFELLALALIAGSLFFFKETLDYLARRDYIAALLVMVIGVAVISVGKEMARLALVQRD